MYKRKWILFAVFIVTGAVILVLIRTGDTKPVLSRDPIKSHTLSKISSHIRNGAIFLQNKNIYGATEVSGNEERSVFKEKLAEEVRRFTEYRRRLDEIHQKSRKQYEKHATLAPARTIGDLWKGLDPHKVETKYPGVQLDGDYMLRPFLDPDDPRAMGMFGNPHTIEEMTDAQAEERFYQLVSVEHVHCSDVRRMGNMGDGGWDVCVVEPFKPHLGCLIYSFGINNDFTFDDAMSETFSCDVKSFDPSMNVDDHMHSDNVLFYNLGLGSKNNITEKEWNIMTLSAILSKLGHSENTIDYLKFDIEFSEWDSLENMVHEQSLANVKQLAFEIHTAEVVHVNRQSNKSDYVRWYTVLLGLEQQGFRRFHYHFNPYGRFTSLRTGRDRSCCYELYYINLKFLDTHHNS